MMERTVQTLTAAENHRALAVLFASTAIAV